MYIVAALIHWSLIFLIIPWVLIIVKMMSSIRCPNCNKPVFEINISPLGVFRPARVSLFIEKCERCNHPFI